MPELSIRQKAKLFNAVALAVLVISSLVVVKACHGYDYTMPQHAMARIWCGPNARGETAGGSGTLIDVNAKHEGVVVTNKHVVADGGPFRVIFADGEKHDAHLLLVGYREVDLAALLVEELGDRQPAIWTDKLDTETYQLFGFGGSNGGKNSFRYMWGSVVGHSTSGAMENFELNAPTRSGDSGGGVFNERGELCGVRWGTGNGSNYGYSTAVHPKNLRDFLSHLKIRPTAPSHPSPPARLAPTPQRTTAQQSQYIIQDCPNGQCQPSQPADGWYSAGPPQQQQPPQESPRLYIPDIVPRPGQQPAPDQGHAAPQPDDKDCCCDCEAKLKELIARIEALEKRKCEPGPAGPPGPAGKDGRDGVAGQNGADATVDLGALADDVAAKLPPIRVIQRDANTGEVIAEKNVPLGGDLTLRFGSKNSVPAK